jgi:hypothetical protein
MNLYLIRDSVTSFGLLIAAESETEATWHWCIYFHSNNDNPIEIEEININTSGIVWKCGWTTDTNP